MTQAITSRHQNNTSSQGKAEEHVGEAQNFSLSSVGGQRTAGVRAL